MWDSDIIKIEDMHVISQHVGVTAITYNEWQNACWAPPWVVPKEHIQLTLYKMESHSGLLPREAGHEDIHIY